MNDMTIEIAGDIILLSEIAGLASPAGRNMIEVVLKSGWEFKVPVGEHGRIKKAWAEYLLSK
jgi:hypothetical protein